MSSTVLYMSISIDGFIAGPNVSIDNGLGDGGERLHQWVNLESGSRGHTFGDLGKVDTTVVNEFMSTGAVLCGRGTIDPAGGWGGDHHDGVPIVVYARNLPDQGDVRWPGVTYLDSIDEAVRLSRAAAGERNVLVHGAGTAQAMLAAGLLDEIQLHVIPVLLGEGRRLFDHLGHNHIEFETVSVRQGTAATHLRYRTIR